MELTHHRLIQDSLINSAKLYPNKIALIYENKEYIYSELYKKSISLAITLKKSGLKKGDRVAIFMDNTLPCIVSIYGILLVGGVFLIINPQTKADKLEYILNDSDAVLLLSDEHLSNTFMPIISTIPKLKTIIYSGKLIKDNTSFPLNTFKNAISINQNEIVKFVSPKTISVDLAALIYTSGTTGHPKGVMMSHQSMVFATESISEYLRLTKDDLILCTIPIAFDYGLYQVLMTIRLGATIILERSFAYPAVIVKHINEYNATVFPGVPTIFKTLISMYERSKLSFPSVTKITNTAAALSPEYLPILKKIFPNALIFKMYGITECKRISYLEPELLDIKPASVGKAIPGTETFILLPDGQKASPGELGILHVRGRHIMMGYWKKPQQSKEMIKEGRFPGDKILCTHDWFSEDEYGFLYFKGRSDDIIKTRGEKVSPVEIENVIHGIKGVKESAVIGVPDELLGEYIKAYIVLEKNTAITVRDIKKTCSLNLENFMVPKEMVIVKEFNHTTTGKIIKNNLDQLEVI